MIAGVIIARALHVHADDSTACIPLARRKNMPAASVGGSVGPLPHADFGASGVFFGTLLGVLVRDDAVEPSARTQGAHERSQAVT